MSDQPTDTPSEAPLNPALKSTRETVYDTRNPTPAPIDTASAREGEGEAWPLVWLAVTIIGVLLAVYFLI